MLAVDEAAVRLGGLPEPGDEESKLLLGGFVLNRVQVGQNVIEDRDLLCRGWRRCRGRCWCRGRRGGNLGLAGAVARGAGHRQGVLAFRAAPALDERVVVAGLELDGDHALQATAVVVLGELGP